MKTQRLLPHWPDMACVLLLFCLALSVRLSYQAEAIIDQPIRADAREYFFLAQNMYRHNVYSSEPPTLSNTPPQPNFRRSPGYPLFLYPFVATSKTTEQFLSRVTAIQALMGSLTAVMTYFMARLCFTLPWACAAALLVALTPHLVAMDHFLLTETLFTFTIMLSTLALVSSWRRKQPIVSVLAGMLFGFSALVRPMAFLLGPFMGSLYLFHHRKWAFAPKSVMLTKSICLLIGCALIYTPYLVLRNKMVSGSFSVSEQSTWHHFILGTDVNLDNFLKSKKDPKLREQTEQMIEDKWHALRVLKKRFLLSPFSHIKWYLGGKLAFMWQWDNIYVGDVYQYPMVKPGFHTNPRLHAIHTLMRWLHWPLYLLTLAAPIFLLVSWRGGLMKPEIVVLLPPLLMFLYFAGLLTLLMPLPRYAIPVRPVAYILAVYGLKETLSALRLVTTNIRNIANRR